MYGNKENLKIASSGSCADFEKEWILEQMFLLAGYAIWFYLFFKLSDPRQWTAEHVLIWLNWAKREFSLEINNFEAFMKMHGRDIVGLGREGFLAIAPPFTGDILWEHLEILQKGELKLSGFSSDSSIKAILESTEHK